MNVYHIHAQNYRSWLDLDLTVPDGVTAITGDNGAGKTSLISVVDATLFGGPLREWLTEGATSMILEVEFEHDANGYRVTRTYTAKGGGKSTLDLAKWHAGGPDGSWASWTAETQRETQATIETLIGLNRDTWRASAYLSQRDGSFADPSVAPRARKQLLVDALNLDLWDRMHGVTKEQAARLAVEAQTIAGRIETLDPTAAGRADADAALEEAVASRDGWRGLVENLTTWRGTIQAAIRDLVDAAHGQDAARTARAYAEGRHRIAVDAATRLRERLVALEPVPAMLAEAESHAGELPAREAALAGARETNQRGRLIDSEWRGHCDAVHVAGDRVRDVVKRIEALRADVEARTRLAAAITTETAPACDACGQPMGTHALITRAANIGREIDALGGQVHTLEAEEQTLREDHRIAIGLRDEVAARMNGASIVDIEPFEVAVSDAQREARGAAMLREKASQIPGLEADLVAARAGVLAVEAELAALPEPEPIDQAAIATAHVEHRRAEADLRVAEQSLRMAEQLVGAAQAAVETALKAGDQLLDARKERQRLDARIAGLDACIAAYGPNGIPAMILETSAIPQLETEANRVLSEFGKSYRVELQTQRAKRGADGIIETLDVIVHGDHGARAYEHFSGGEQTRINLALRIALAILLASRRGADVRVFLIDEPNGLDTAGMERLAAILRRVSETFDRILIVSHHSDLRDAFDNVLEVDRDEAGASRLETT